MHTVFLRGFECYAFHGVGAAEREVGHRYVADVEVDVASVGDADDLAHTVDYGALADLIQREVGDGAFRTLERIAGHVANAVLQGFPAANAVRVSIAKRLPPLPYVIAEAGVELSRERAS